MRSGLLWYDANADQKLMDVIDDAAKRYREKFGFSPDTCFCNPAQLKAFATAHRAALPRTLNLAVKPKNTIMKNHVWLGISETAPTLEQVAQFEQAKRIAAETHTPRVALIVNRISGAEADGSDALDNCDGASQ